MPRRTSRKSSSSVPVFKKPAKANPPQTSHRSQSSSPSVLSSVGQGMSLGAGAAIGSTMVHGALGTLAGSSNSNNNDNNNFETESKQKCLDIFKQYNECASSTNDLNLCKPYIDFYTQCVQGQSGFN